VVEREEETVVVWGEVREVVMAVEKAVVTLEGEVTVMEDMEVVVTVVEEMEEAELEHIFDQNSLVEGGVEVMVEEI
jgi:hypothetical protein